MSAPAGQVHDWVLGEQITEFLRPWSEGGQAEGSNDFISRCLGVSLLRVDAALVYLKERGRIYQTSAGTYRLTPKTIAMPGDA